MLRQIARDYRSLPDPRTLTLTNIRWFYDGLRRELQEHTKPKKADQPPPPRATRPLRRRFR